MRFATVILLILSSLFGAVSLMAADVPKDLDVDIDIGTKSERAWYKNPVVIGMGIVILVLIVALAGRGGTTIVRRG